MEQNLLSLKATHAPQDFARVLQEQGDIFFSPLDGVWVVTAYELAKQILTNPDFSCQRLPYFAARMPELDIALIANFVAVVSKMMVMSDAPQHTGRRRICYHAFTAKLIASLQPKIKEAIQKALSKMQNSVEIAGEFSEVVTADVLADLFMVPEKSRAEFFYWSNTMTQFFGGAAEVTDEVAKEVNHCAKSLYQYFYELIQLRRAQPTEDFMSVMLQYQSDYELTDDEVISQAIMFLVAGQVTTADQFSNNLYQLLVNPGLFEELKNSQNYDLAIDELTRIDPAVSFTDRIVTKDLDCGGLTLAAGSVVLIANFALNHDTRQFVEPYRIQLQRENNKHMSFGFGTHFCLGSKLAKILMVNMMQSLIQKMPNIQLDPQNAAIKKHGSLAFSGFEKLYVVNAL
jgi:cytochrome P450